MGLLSCSAGPGHCHGHKAVEAGGLWLVLSAGDAYSKFCALHTLLSMSEDLYAIDQAPPP